jgi:hypothetical protein
MKRMRGGDEEGIELIEHVRPQEKTMEDGYSCEKLFACTLLSHTWNRNNSVSHIIAQDYSQHYLVHKKFSQIGDWLLNGHAITRAIMTLFHGIVREGLYQTSMDKTSTARFLQFHYHTMIHLSEYISVNDMCVLLEYTENILYFSYIL